MWQNFVQGTEAALAAALEQANFPQSEDEQKVKSEKSVTASLVETNEEKQTKDETTHEENPPAPAKSWFDEDENAEEPSIDNWFALPGVSSSATSVVPTSMTSLLPTVVESLPSAVTSVFATTSNTSDQETKKDLSNTSKTSGSDLLETFQSTLSVIQQAAQEQIMEANRIFQDNHYFMEAPRDLSLPLDRKVLQDAQVMYLTDRIIVMSHPMISTSQYSPGKKVVALAHLLKKRHDDHYMIWNFSNVSYDYTVFQNQVLDAPLPSGGSQPSFSYQLHILVSIYKWLQESSSDKSVAVFHCHQANDGSLGAILACFFSWLKEADLTKPMEALEYIAQCHDTSIDIMTNPSQRRYLSNFQSLIQEDGGIRPKVAPILLKRIILSHVPKMGTKPDQESSENIIVGCAPYIQIFKEGKLIQTYAGMANDDQDRSQQLKDDNYLPFFVSEDGMTISFQMDLEIYGDILFRCRHLSTSDDNENEQSSDSAKERITMFRACFHTGFVETSKVLRFTKSQLDGLFGNRKGEDIFPDEFHVDLIFESYTGASMTSSEGVSEKKTQGKSKDVAILPSKFDSIFYKESSFWEVLAERRMMHSSQEKKPSEVLLAGDIIGRRRDLSSSSKITIDDHSSHNSSVSSSSSQSTDALSINGSLGFEMIEGGSITEDSSTGLTQQRDQKEQYQEKKQELQQLLSDSEEEEPDLVVIGKDGNAADEEDEDEEIIFDEQEKDETLKLNLSEEEDQESESIKSEMVEVDNIYIEDTTLDDLDDFENFLKQM